MPLTPLEYPRVRLTTAYLKIYNYCKYEALAIIEMTSKTKSFASNRRALNVTGLRVTSQRALILEIIRREHLDADEVYRQARTK